LNLQIQNSHRFGYEVLPVGKNSDEFIVCQLRVVLTKSRFAHALFLPVRFTCSLDENSIATTRQRHSNLLLGADRGRLFSNGFWQHLQSVVHRGLTTSHPASPITKNNPMKVATRTPITDMANTTAVLRFTMHFLKEL